MEKRTVEQVKIYTLVLNDIRATNIEIGTLTPHVAYEQQHLIDFIKGEVESWKDGSWNKSFKKGSDLEWYNGLANVEDRDKFGHGVNWEWIGVKKVEELIKTGHCKLIVSGGVEAKSDDLIEKPEEATEEN